MSFNQRIGFLFDFRGSKKPWLPPRILSSFLRFALTSRILELLNVLDDELCVLQVF